MFCITNPRESEVIEVRVNGEKTTDWRLRWGHTITIGDDRTRIEGKVEVFLANGRTLTYV